MVDVFECILHFWHLRSALVLFKIPYVSQVCDLLLWLAEGLLLVDLDAQMSQELHCFACPLQCLSFCLSQDHDVVHKPAVGDPPLCQLFSDGFCRSVTPEGIHTTAKGKSMCLECLVVVPDSHPMSSGWMKSKVMIVRFQV